MPKKVDHATRRTEIVYAVWAIMATRGLGAVTLRAVAAEAGISVGRIQHYYASRDDLIHDSCRMMLEVSATQFETAHAATPAAERLHDLVTRTIPTTETFSIGTAVWLAYQAYSIADPVIAELVREGHRGAVEQAAATLAEIGVADPGRTALQLLSGAEGLATRVLVGSLTADEALTLLEDLVRSATATR